MMFISKGELESLRIGRATNDAGLLHVENLLSELFMRIEENKQELQKLRRRVAQLECPHTVETTDCRPRYPTSEQGVCRDAHIKNNRGMGDRTDNPSVSFQDRWIMFTCVTCGKQRYETWAGMSKKKRACFIKNGNVPASWGNVKNEPHKETK